MSRSKPTTNGVIDGPYPAVSDRLPLGAPGPDNPRASRQPGTYGGPALAVPDDLDEAEIGVALSASWGFEATAIEYAPLGFGSYHWVVADAAGSDGSSPSTISTKAFRSSLASRRSRRSTRAWLGPRAPEVIRRLEAFDRLSSAVESKANRRVITHGEPHPGNLMRLGNELLLVDWDTVGLAPPSAIFG